jgi:hypothetical protein
MEPRKNVPNKGDIILLFYKDHYNAVRTYQQAIKNIMKDDNI